MAGKPTALAGKSLTYALDKLSKNCLIDLVVDRARAEIGEEATDSQVAALVQEWIGPVWRVREDKPVDLVAAANATFSKPEQACESCWGYGHINDETGRPSVDRRHRQCGDCRGTGRAK